MVEKNIWTDSKVVEIFPKNNMTVTVDYRHFLLLLFFLNKN